MIKWAMTTSKSRNSLPEEVLMLCAKYQIPVIARQNKGIAYLMAHHGLACLLVLEDDELVAYTGEERLNFHPGMAVPRVKRWMQGVEETLTAALQLKSGEHFLDCTMGLASDALVASVMVGESGSVVCLEKSMVIYIITMYGLVHYNKGSAQLQQAMRRIQPKWADYRDRLAQMMDNSVDVVYFDPMFERPLIHSPGIANLRKLAVHEQPTMTDYAQARRVARKRVVVKHAKGEMANVDFDEVLGGRYSTTQYGIFYGQK